MDEISNGWRGPAKGKPDSVVIDLFEVDWRTPSVDPGVALFLDLAPGVDLLLEASARPRLFADGRQARELGALAAYSRVDYTGMMRRATRTLSIAARVAARSGAFDRMLACTQASFRLSRLLSQCPDEIGRLTAHSTYLSTLRDIAWIAGTHELPASVCQALLDELRALDIEWFEDPIIAEAEWHNLRELDAVWRRDLRELPMLIRLDIRLRSLVDGADSLGADDLEVSEWMRWLGGVSARDADRIFNEYATRLAGWWKTTSIARPADPPAIEGHPYLDKPQWGSRGFVALLRTEIRAHILVLTLELHHGAHGAWPVTLDDFDEAVASDPVTGRRFLYEREVRERSGEWPFTLRAPYTADELEALGFGRPMDSEALERYTTITWRFAQRSSRYDSTPVWEEE